MIMCTEHPYVKQLRMMVREIYLRPSMVRVRGLRESAGWNYYNGRSCLMMMKTIGLSLNQMSILKEQLLDPLQSYELMFLHHRAWIAKHLRKQAGQCHHIREASGL